jgi:hypothetical protein
MMQYIFRSVFCFALVAATSGIALAQQADAPTHRCFLSPARQPLPISIAAAK